MAAYNQYMEYDPLMTRNLTAMKFTIYQLNKLPVAPETASKNLQKKIVRKGHIPIKRFEINGAPMNATAMQEYIRKVLKHVNTLMSELDYYINAFEHLFVNRHSALPMLKERFFTRISVEIADAIMPVLDTLIEFALGKTIIINFGDNHIYRDQSVWDLHTLVVTIREEAVLQEGRLKDQANLALPAKFDCQIGLSYPAPTQSPRELLIQFCMEICIRKVSWPKFMTIDECTTVTEFSEKAQSVDSLPIIYQGVTAELRRYIDEMLEELRQYFPSNALLKCGPRMIFYCFTCGTSSSTCEAIKCIGLEPFFRQFWDHRVPKNHSLSVAFTDEKRKLDIARDRLAQRIQEQLLLIGIDGEEQDHTEIKPDVLREEYILPSYVRFEAHLGQSFIWALKPVTGCRTDQFLRGYKELYFPLPWDPKFYDSTVCAEYVAAYQCMKNERVEQRGRRTTTEQGMMAIILFCFGQRLRILREQEALP